MATRETRGAKPELARKLNAARKKALLPSSREPGAATVGCPKCNQTFDSDEKLQLHCKYWHDALDDEKVVASLENIVDPTRKLTAVQQRGWGQDAGEMNVYHQYWLHLGESCRRGSPSFAEALTSFAEALEADAAVFKEIMWSRETAPDVALRSSQLVGLLAAFSLACFQLSAGASSRGVCRLLVTQRFFKFKLVDVFGFTLSSDEEKQVKKLISHDGGRHWPLVFKELKKASKEKAGEQAVTRQARAFLKFTESCQFIKTTIDFAAKELQDRMAANELATRDLQDRVVALEELRPDLWESSLTNRSIATLKKMYTLDLPTYVGCYLGKGVSDGGGDRHVRILVRIRQGETREDFMREVKAFVRLTHYPMCAKLEAAFQCLVPDESFSFYCMVQLGDGSDVKLTDFKGKASAGQVAGLVKALLHLIHTAECQDLMLPLSLEHFAVTSKGDLELITASGARGWSEQVLEACDLRILELSCMETVGLTMAAAPYMKAALAVHELMTGEKLEMPFFLGPDHYEHWLKQYLERNPAVGGDRVVRAIYEELLTSPLRGPRKNLYDQYLLHLGESCRRGSPSFAEALPRKRPAAEDLYCVSPGGKMSKDGHEEELSPLSDR